MNETNIGKKSLGSLTLVIGVDGTGKSTFLNQLERVGYNVSEPTSTTESLAFKASSIDRLIDNDFIDERELLFTAMNRLFDESTNEKRRKGIAVATTGNLIVTKVSHAVMRSVIGQPINLEEIIQNWGTNGDSQRPDRLILVHAPYSTIRRRVMARQNAGDRTEKFWGFNSPFFLDCYQEAWRSILPIIEDQDVQVMSFDTSQQTPGEMLDTFIAA